MNRQPTVYWIDLFCGAGGTTTGIHMANANAKVLACVNHDAEAIKSHLANHPDCEHFTEDIRDIKVVYKILELVKQKRIDEPNCIINIWASLECTNYSKAKGGRPRDADSRTLALSLFMYIDILNPTYIFIENVREFMAWGSLDCFGKPVSKDKGKDYLKWIDNVCNRGYNFDFKILNSANFGAYTSRERFFGQFALNGYPIKFPTATHVKKAKNNPGLFDENLPLWKPVKEVLQLDIEGESIFTRKKPLVDNTLERIYAGLVKFVAKGDTCFRKRYNGGKTNPQEKVKSLNEPMGTLLTNGTHAIVKSVFIKKYFSGRPEGKVISINEPAGTITTVGGQAVCTALHLNTYYGNSGLHSVEKPSPTVTTKDRISIVKCIFIDQQFGKSKPSSVDTPAGSLTTVPKLSLVTVKFLMNPQFKSEGSSIENPCFTLIARMDKKPPYIVNAELGEGYICIYDDDTESMKKIKYFMAEHGIIDIKMRMLLIQEMLLIQGFPENYILTGTETNKKKFIGNSVECNTAKMIIEANYNGILEHLQLVS